MDEDGQPNTKELLQRYDNEFFRNGHNNGTSIKVEPNASNSSSEESPESPLDFSFKRKSEQLDSSGRESCKDSPRSGCDSNYENDRRSSVDSSERHGLTNGIIDHDESFDKEEQIGEPKPSVVGGGNGGSIPNLAGMMSALQAGMVPPASMLGAFPAMAALIDPRFAQANNKSSRPFKSYPKEALSMPLGSYGVPGFNAFQSMDNGALQNMNLNSEELMNLYKQQILSLRDRARRLDNISSPKSNASSTSSQSSSSTGSNPENGHKINSSNNDNSDMSIFHTPNSMTSNVDSTQKLPIAHPASSIISMQTSSRKRPRSLPDAMKDEAYWDRRRKNNDAAKRSRDARRAKEDEIAIRAALLEQENLKLRVEVAALKTETAKLRCILYNS